MDPVAASTFTRLTHPVAPAKGKGALNPAKSENKCTKQGKPATSISDGRKDETTLCSLASRGRDISLQISRPPGDSPYLHSIKSDRLPSLCLGLYLGLSIGHLRPACAP